ncbi:hypothetical protein B0H11DRAFT_1934923 [Mycena galericulata]|nr:hypothetical protein B0H11DRAFT_1934923 [Mycena galericulata]
MDGLWEIGGTRLMRRSVQQRQTQYGGQQGNRQNNSFTAAEPEGLAGRRLDCVRVVLEADCIARACDGPLNVPLPRRKVPIALVYRGCQWLAVFPVYHLLGGTCAVIKPRKVGEFKNRAKAGGAKSDKIRLNWTETKERQKEVHGTLVQEQGRLFESHKRHNDSTKDKIRKNRARIAFGMPKLRGFTDCNMPGSYGKLSREVQYIKYAILELMEYQTDEPVRAKLREMVNVTT